MVLLKLVLHVETIRFAGIPKGKKAIADRKKRLDELADQVHSLIFFFLILNFFSKIIDQSGWHDQSPLRRGTND